MLLYKYLREHINKETTIESKDHGILTGTISAIDKQMNIVVDNAVIRGRKTKRIQIRGSRLRSFYL